MLRQLFRWRGRRSGEPGAGYPEPDADRLEDRRDWFQYHWPCVSRNQTESRLPAPLSAIAIGGIQTLFSISNLPFRQYRIAWKHGTGRVGQGHVLFLQLRRLTR